MVPVLTSDRALSVAPLTHLHLRLWFHPLVSSLLKVSSTLMASIISTQNTPKNKYSALFTTFQPCISSCLPYIFICMSLEYDIPGHLTGLLWQNLEKQVIYFPSFETVNKYCVSLSASSHLLALAHLCPGLCQNALLSGHHSEPGDLNTSASFSPNLHILPFPVFVSDAHHSVTQLWTVAFTFNWLFLLSPTANESPFLTTKPS